MRFLHRYWWFPIILGSSYSQDMTEIFMDIFEIFMDIVEIYMDIVEIFMDIIEFFSHRVPCNVSRS